MNNHLLSNLLLFSIIISQLSTSTTSSLIPEGYDPHTRPNNGGVADVINVSLDIVAVREVNEDLHHISVEFVLRSFWEDKRLANLVERETIFAETSATPVKIWTPQLSIVNGAESPHRSGKVLTLKPDGTVDSSERISAKISCPMSMMRYPFGKQHCKIQFVSYGYSSIHLILLWNGIIPLDTISTFDPEYALYDVEQSSEKQKMFDGKTSHYILNVAISLRRSPLRLIGTSLLPTFLLAAFSYFVTFFMGSFTGERKVKAFVKINSLESESEKRTLEEGEEQEIQSHSQDEELQMPTPTEPRLKLSNLSSYIAVDIIKAVVNVFILLIVVVVKQINFIKSPRSSAPTALDIWMGFMSLSILLCFLLQLQICFKKCRPLLQGRAAEGASDDNYGEERTRSVKILRISIPAVFLIFLIAFIGLCFS